MLNGLQLFFEACARFFKTGMMFANVHQFGICLYLEIPSCKKQAFPPNWKLGNFP